MSTKSYIFAGIMSAIIGNAFAAGENTVTSKSYVDAQDALKQDLIPVETMTINAGKGTILTVPDKLVTYPTTTDGDLGKYGIFDQEFFSSFPENFMSLDASALSNEIYADTIPTTNIVGQTMVNELSFKQNKIYRSGYRGYAAPITGDGWLNSYVKGTGLVTKTDTDGVVGERKIFEASDVSGYHAQGLTQSEKDIQDISIPTVGAMMTAISNGVNAATPTGTPNTIANYGANGELDSGIATYTGAAAYNATNDSAKIPTMAGVATYAQAKMTCAGWPESVPVNQRTDANCWLWNKN